MPNREDEIENLHNVGGGDSFTEQQIRSAEAPDTIQLSKEQKEGAPPLTKPVINSLVNSTFSARPINNVDTFGVNPVINGGNVQLIPANIPIVFEYQVNVPHGRTYILRDFYFVPTRFLYDANNNPIQDLFTVTFFVNDAPVTQNSGLTFPSWGTGGYVEGYFVAGENSVVTMKAEITNAAYVDLDPAFPVYMGASIQMRFNALVDNGAPHDLQPGNIVDNLNSLQRQGVRTEEDDALAGIKIGNKVYRRPV